jgi:hypothetical protein
MTCPLSGSPNIIPIAWHGPSGKTLRRCGGSGQKLEVPIDSLETCSDDFQPELEGLRKSDPSLCQQVEAFAKVLGASVDMVVPRGAPDPLIVGGMP